MALYIYIYICFGLFQVLVIERAHKLKLSVTDEYLMKDKHNPKDMDSVLRKNGYILRKVVIDDHFYVHKSVKK